MFLLNYKVLSCSSKLKLFRTLKFSAVQIKVRMALRTAEAGEKVSHSCCWFGGGSEKCLSIQIFKTWDRAEIRNLRPAFY